MSLKGRTRSARAPRARGAAAATAAGARGASNILMSPSPCARAGRAARRHVRARSQEAAGSVEVVEVAEEVAQEAGGEVAAGPAEAAAGAPEEINIEESIGGVTSLLSDLFRDIQSTKAARETVEKTRMQQLFDVIGNLEGELDGGMRRVNETVRSVEQTMKLEVKHAIDGVWERVDIELGRVRAEFAKLRGDVDGLLSAARREQDAQLNDAIALSNERISLLKQALSSELAESREGAHAMVDALGARMTESDIETREGIKKIFDSKCEHIEATILSEATARAEEDQAITTHVKTIVLAMRHEMGEEISALRAELTDCVRDANGELAAAVERGRAEAERDREAMAERLEAAVRGASAALQEEHEKRVEDETRLLKSFDEDIMDLNEKLERELKELKSVLAGQGAAMEEMRRAQEETRELLQRRVAEAEGALRGRIDEEKRERMVEDKRIVDAVNEYTRALQDALRTINGS